MDFGTVSLKKGKERKVRNFYPWIQRGECRAEELQRHVLPTLLEQAALAGKAVGVVSTARLTRRLFSEWPNLDVVVALAVVLEWHLAWSAFAGMETLLFTALCLLLLL